MISLNDLTEAPEVIVRPALHYGKKVTGIFFAKDFRLLKAVKHIQGARFSKSLKGWYTERRKGLADEICAAFEGLASVNVQDMDFDRDKDEAWKQRQGADKLCPKEYVDHLTRKRYSGATVKNYCTQFGFFIDYIRKPLAEVTEEDIMRYIEHIVTGKKVSTSTQNMAINAIKFYFEKVKGETRKYYGLERPLKEMKLPLVLSEEEVVAIMKACENLKHKMMLYLTYAAGLRRSELINLKISDINTDRKLITIHGGKGKKDRITLLSEKVIVLLQSYLEKYNPSDWIFEGEGGEQYAASSLQKVFKNALEKSGVARKATLHTLRHSFATHLLESGTDIRYIQALLGHHSSRTTEIYAHVTRKGFEKIRSPLDNLPL